MTTRERFRETMTYGKPDRLPYFEEGIRRNVLKAWSKQGLSNAKKLKQMFIADQFHEVAPDLEPMPSVKKWPASINEVYLLKKHLNANDPVRLPKKCLNNIQQAQKKGEVIFLRVHRGFFLTMGVYKWRRFTKVLTSLMEEPLLVHNILQVQADFANQVAQKILQEMEIDAVIFSEPISGNEGPLISPDMYEEFVLRSFEPLFLTIKKHNIDTIIFRTYANSRILIPKILKYGINCLWACETNVQAMDYRDLRQTFGRDLRLIGGIDLDVLRRDKEAIRREIEEKVPPLVNDGGYVPLADGRVRSDISFENYIYFRRLLEKVTRG